VTPVASESWEGNVSEGTTADPQARSGPWHQALGVHWVALQSIAEMQ